MIKTEGLIREHSEYNKSSFCIFFFVSKLDMRTIIYLKKYDMTTVEKYRFNFNLSHVESNIPKGSPMTHTAKIR